MRLSAIKIDRQLKDFISFCIVTLGIACVIVIGILLTAGRGIEDSVIQIDGGYRVKGLEVVENDRSILVNIHNRENKELMVSLSKILDGYQLDKDDIIAAITLSENDGYSNMLSILFKKNTKTESLLKIPLE